MKKELRVVLLKRYNNSESVWVPLPYKTIEEAKKAFNGDEKMWENADAYFLEVVLAGKRMFIPADWEFEKPFHCFD